MPEHNTSQPPLLPPHRPTERRLKEQFIIDPGSGEAKAIPPLHSDTYGKLALRETAIFEGSHYDLLEERAYI